MARAHANFNPVSCPTASCTPGPGSIDHSTWTRKWIIERLRARRSWPAEDLIRFLTSYGVACVVTVQEHAVLSGVSGEGWDRYRAAGITVWDRELQSTADLGGHEIASERPEPVVGQTRETGGSSLDDAPDVAALVDEKAEPAVGRRLHRLLRMARFASATAVPSLQADGELSGYFRVHDALHRGTHASCRLPALVWTRGDESRDVVYDLTR